MRRPALTSTVVIVLLLTLGACGGSDDPAPAGGSADTSSSAAPDAAADDASSDTVDPCSLLTPEQVGPVLGGTVTLKEAPGGGCGFDQDDPRAPSVGFFAVVDAGGGFDASKAGLVVDGDVQDVPGVGDGAWIATGTSGGDNVQGQGVVALGDTLVNISLTQGNGLDEATVARIVTDLASLVGSLG